MEQVNARIKEYVLVLSPSILSDLSISDAFLNVTIQEIVDRTLLYTNRVQLLDGYAEFLAGNYYDQNTEYDLDGDRVPILPIPTQMERALAGVVISTCRRLKELLTSNGTISRLVDNGQEVDYSEYLNSYLSSSTDADIYAGVTELLDKFRIPDIVENSNRF